jgi:hypothetical protein
MLPRPRSPPLSVKGVLFPGLDAVTNDFAEFVELLNIGAIIDRHHLAFRLLL